MVEDGLPRGGQLANLHLPVDFHDEQCAGADNSILGGLEGLKERPDVLEQGGGDICVLVVGEPIVSSVNAGQKSLPPEGSPGSFFHTGLHTSEPRPDNGLISLVDGHLRSGQPLSDGSLNPLVDVLIGYIDRYGDNAGLSVIFLIGDRAGSGGTGRFRRLASSTTMDAAQIRPSTVNGNR